MENRVAIEQMNVVKNQLINPYFNHRNTSIDLIRNSPVSEILTAEGHENLVNYLKRLGIDEGQNQVVLSSQHHYFYDAEEIKFVKTVINLKELNQIKHVKSFLHSIFNILPYNTSFIGCFVDNKKFNGYELRDNVSSYRNHRSYEDIENGIVSRFPFLNMLYSLMDSKTNKYMSRRSVSILFRDHGFKILDMTELNGLTYFHAQKVRSAEN